MNHKKKKCKGINKASGFNGCGVETYYRKYGLCPSCLSDWFETETGKVFFEKLTLKATKSSRELENLKKERKNRNTLGAELEKTQKLFNKYIRLRDKGKPCISSEIPYKNDFDAGHCFPVGSYSGLRFNYDNAHGQSIGDNRFKEGNHVDYLINLPKRIGQERFDALVKAAEEYKKFGYKFSREELNNIREELSQKIKELK